MATPAGYLRHRHRHIQESIIQDVQDTLIACRWMAGTTSREVENPENYQVETVTTEEDETFPLLEGAPIVLIDFFPETDGIKPDNGTAPNTLAVNQGEPGEPELLELGNALAAEQPYSFRMAFYAISDAVALAVLSDLKDRYRGALVSGPVVGLYDFSQDSPEFVSPLEVEAFDFYKDDYSVSPSAAHLFFAELLITDIVDY
jgi:hypothetical protein